MSLRVSISTLAHLGLLGTHVGRRADELLERGEERLVGQASRRRLGDAEVDHLRASRRVAVVDGHEDVRRLDVAVNDSLLMRVLDGLANLNEQIRAAPPWTVCFRRSIP